MINFISKVMAADNTEETLRHAGDVGSYITILYKWVLPFCAGLAVLMMIYAGYLYMTSQGNPDNMKQAKDYIISALVGLALIILAGVILRSVIGVKVG